MIRTHFFRNTSGRRSYSSIECSAIVLTHGAFALSVCVCGPQDPLVIMDDADLDSILPMALKGR
jgi:hypothetical protein